MIRRSIFNGRGFVALILVFLVLVLSANDASLLTSERLEKNDG